MSNSEEKRKIVVIDDEQVVLKSCEKILTRDGFQVATFQSGTRGLEEIGEVKPDLVLVDLKMSEISGMEVIKRVHAFNPSIIIIVITAYATIAGAVEAIKSGAYDFLTKPFFPDELRMVINKGFEHRRLLYESHRQEMEREMLKRRFVSMVAHQLKSPLVAVRQYLDVMKHMDESPESSSRWQEWLERCIKRTNELLL